MILILSCFLSAAIGVIIGMLIVIYSILDKRLDKRIIELELENEKFKNQIAVADKINEYLRNILNRDLTIIEEFELCRIVISIYGGLIPEKETNLLLKMLKQR